MAIAATVGLHALAVGLLFSAPPLVHRSTLPVYSVELVAAPRPQPQQRRAPETVQRPAQQQPTVPERPRPQRTSVSPETPPPTPQPQQTEPAPRTTPAEAPAPDVEPSTGSDAGTVKTSGVDFPFPGYLRNIVNQVYRRWQRPSGQASLRAEVLFLIHRDGTISGFQFVKRSGNFAFDLEAQGAIEEAATYGAFGPLPEGYPADILPVSFFFDPTTIR